jgi:hypothetical protein
VFCFCLKQAFYNDLPTSISHVGRIIHKHHSAQHSSHFFATESH